MRAKTNTKAIKIIMVVALMIIFLTSVSSLVFAAPKSDYVQLVENTDQCFECHTI